MVVVDAHDAGCVLSRMRIAALLVCRRVGIERECGEYLLPLATDVPRVKIVHHETSSPLNPLGVKGAGEGGTVGALSAVMNAVNDALAAVGVRNLQMPATSDRVWRAIRDARGN